MTQEENLCIYTKENDTEAHYSSVHWRDAKIAERICFR